MKNTFLIIASIIGVIILIPIISIIGTSIELVCTIIGIVLLLLCVVKTIIDEIKKN
jgi:O-antigen/teichoic acid export membrane protein